MQPGPATIVFYTETWTSPVASEAMVISAQVWDRHQASLATRMLRLEVSGNGTGFNNSATYIVMVF